MKSNRQLSHLDERRQELGISYAALAEECGVSLPTVQRILSGKHTKPTLANVVAIAEALGVQLQFEPTMSANAMWEAQAKKKAESIVNMVQATSGLEAQGLDKETIARMISQTIHELMAGSRRKLWSA